MDVKISVHAIVYHLNHFGAVSKCISLHCITSRLPPHLQKELFLLSQ